MSAALSIKLIFVLPPNKQVFVKVTAPPLSRREFVTFIYCSRGKCAVVGGHPTIFIEFRCCCLKHSMVQSHVQCMNESFGERSYGKIHKSLKELRILLLKV